MMTGFTADQYEILKKAFSGEIDVTNKENSIKLFNTDIDQIDKINEYLVSFEKSKDYKSIEWSLFLANQFGHNINTYKILCNLIIEDWHFVHEKIVAILELNLVDVCLKNILLSTEIGITYIRESDYPAFEIRCAWFFYKIGSAEARECLERMTKSPRREVAKVARERLRALKSR